MYPVLECIHLARSFRPPRESEKESRGDQSLVRVYGGECSVEKEKTYAFVDQIDVITTIRA